MSSSLANLYDLGEALAAPLERVTTDQVADARIACTMAAVDRGYSCSCSELGDLLQALGIDDQGIADGIARGVWTEVSA